MQWPVQVKKLIKLLPRDSDTGSPIPVIEYEDTRNQIELTDENIQGIVSLRMERNAVKGETEKKSWKDSCQQLCWKI